jgi:hypothetical protein
VQPSPEQVTQHQRAEEVYREVRANRPHVEKLRASLLDHLEANHFAERLAQVMRETRRAT